MIPAVKKAGELWAVALDAEGKFLVGTTYDGRVNVWALEGQIDEKSGNEQVKANSFAAWETRGGYGLAVDVVSQFCVRLGVLTTRSLHAVFTTDIFQSPDNTLTATSHPTGNIYVFSTSTTRLLRSLPTQSLAVRTIRFSPGSTLLAAAGDSTLISLYDVRSGEVVALLRGHEAWITSLSWSHTGEYLLSGSLDGKVKVWSVETRQCVCTMTEGEGKGLWSVSWLPKGPTSGEARTAERFVVGGNGGSLGVYREASGAS